MTFAGDSRYQVDHSDDSNEWGLMLTNVHLNDAGVYECQINVEPKLKRAIHLIVTSGKILCSYFSGSIFETIICLINFIIKYNE